jgi:hypothetical protein
MKNALKILIMTLAFVLCVILEVLQKMVIWDSTLKENLKYTYRDYKATLASYSKKIYWPEVIGVFAGIFAVIAVYYSVVDNLTKTVISSIMSVVVISWALLLDTRPTYQVTGKNKWSIYVLFLLFVMIVLFSSCSQGQCPTTNKKYFYKGVPRPKPLYKGYGSQKGYVVPYKYRRNVPNYGKTKLFGKG